MQEKKQVNVKGPQGLQHLIAACQYSLAGYKTVFADEVAFRFILVEALILIPLAFYIAQNFVTTIILILPIFIAIIVELLNSAIENTIDRISLEIHPLSKKAKDMGSAAQMTTQILIIFIWWLYLLAG